MNNRVKTTIHSKKPYKGRRRRKTNGKNSVKAGTKLMICIMILFFAVVIKICFPQITEKAASIITDEVDFKAVFQTLGEGLSGETPMKDALSEAYKIAFSQNDEDAVQASKTDNIDTEKQ